MDQAASSPPNGNLPRQTGTTAANGTPAAEAGRASQGGEVAVGSCGKGGSKKRPAEDMLQATRLWKCHLGSALYLKAEAMARKGMCNALKGHVQISEAIDTIQSKTESTRQLSKLE